MSKCFNILIILAALTFFAADTPNLKHEEKVDLKVKEPSGISWLKGTDNYVIVSDRGKIYTVDKKGKTIEKSEFEGKDFEGVYANTSSIYVVEEGSSQVHKLKIKDLVHQKSVEIPYKSKNNNGFESITYNEKKNCFLLVSEKDPSMIFELNDNLTVAAKIENKEIPEVSDVTYYKNYLWFLSDEKERVYKVSPEDYSVIAKWDIKVDKPEGITFNQKGQMVIVSDEDEEMYFYDYPE